MNQLKALQFPKLSDAEYERRLPVLQQQLSRLQIALFHLKKRAVILLEGSDAAGKGGAIHRMIQAMDPRGYRVYPIGPPSQSEAERHYLQRFWRRIPKAGQVAIFDRSWYGRVLVERVDKLADQSEWQRAYREINDFERFLVDDGIILVKLLLVITRDEQRRRFIKRLKIPEKQWKLTLDDLHAHQKTDSYLVAFQEMLDKTSSDSALWHLVPANDKKYARTSVLSTVVEELSKHINLGEISYASPEVIEKARQVLDLD